LFEWVTGRWQLPVQYLQRKMIRICFVSKSASSKHISSSGDFLSSGDLSFDLGGRGVQLLVVVDVLGHLPDLESDRVSLVSLQKFWFNDNKSNKYIWQICTHFHIKWQYEIMKTNSLLTLTLQTFVNSGRTCRRLFQGCQMVYSNQKYQFG
jgi:hypothetical protein